MSKFITGDLLPSIERTITQEHIVSYSMVSGDINPLHIDATYASKSQFGRTIAHGMLVAATISEIMAISFNMGWVEGGRLKLRFKQPVFPGDKVSAYGIVKKVKDIGLSQEVTCEVGVKKGEEDVITGIATALQ